MSLAVLAKATLLHKHISGLGSSVVPSPCVTGMLMAPAVMTQLTLTLGPVDFHVLSHNGSTRVEGSSLGPRDMGELHPVAPLGESPHRIMRVPLVRYHSRLGCRIGTHPEG